MRDFLSNMIRLPLEFAKFGFEQMQTIFDELERSQRNRHAMGRFEDSGSMNSGKYVSRGRHETTTSAYLPGNSETHAEPPFQNSPQSGSSDVPDPNYSFSQPNSEQFGNLDATKMVVIGDDLAAGLVNFSLLDQYQQLSFPNQLARHFRVEFSQPMFQAPGISCGCRASHLPGLGQTTVFSKFPPPSPFSNCSVPGFTLEDALTLRPKPPLINQHDSKQTFANFLIDPRAMIEGNCRSQPSLVESAIRQQPTLALLSIGFNDVLSRDEKLSVSACSISQFAFNYRKILEALDAAGAQVAVVNICDPIDTALFSTIDSASSILRIPASALTSLYGLDVEDRLTIDGILEIGFQINSRSIRPISNDLVLKQEQARSISEKTDRINAEIVRLSSEYNAAHVDVAAFAKRIYKNGVNVAGRQLRAEFLGGIYSLNGYTPGPTGQALIANEVIGSLNQKFDASIAFVDAGKVMLKDSIAEYRKASGEAWSEDALSQMTVDSSAIPIPIQTLECTNKNRQKSNRLLNLRSQEESYVNIYRDSPSKPLILPEGLEQELPLFTGSSYFGDAIFAVDCNEGEHPTGCPRIIFDGLAMTASSLSGSVTIRFADPQDDITRFEVEFGAGLIGTDGVLTAPEFLRIPVKRGFVQVFPGRVCSGKLNLISGEVSEIDFNFLFNNSALEALVKVNPEFPQVPIQFPGQYGTALIRFVQRDDGRLDFVFSGTAFAPVGATTRFPLPFESASGEFASIPASGTALHPHIHLSTRDLSVARCGDKLDIPTNSVHELTTTVSKTDFGDDFNLNNPALGFARGRSQLTGRLLIQFGERFGDHVPFSVSLVPPGGSMFAQDISLLQNLFPGQLYQGLIGHDSVLRFPNRTYRTNDMYLMNDPFDIPWGVVNVNTGEVSGDFLHRAFFGQDVFFALIRVEPRTPQGSFEYRGPARFDRTNSQLRFRFNGVVTLPYQPGFLFPKPNLVDGFAIGENSSLDPYFQLDAGSGRPLMRAKAHSESQKLSTNGELFSYRFVCSNSNHVEFEYSNHSQGGSFTLKSVTRIDASSSSSHLNISDTITFSGFGIWSLDYSKKLHSVEVQIISGADHQYVSILVGGGKISNVNTQPIATPPLTKVQNLSAARSSTTTSSSDRPLPALKAAHE